MFDEVDDDNKANYNWNLTMSLMSVSGYFLKK